MTSLDRLAGARVLVTGDTGFKGTWLVEWLRLLGAEVHGLGLPAADDAMFRVIGAADGIDHVDLDVRDRRALREHVARVQPEAVFHLAAQSLVRRSFEEPLATIDTNVTGTANLLAALSDAGYGADRPCAVVVVTSDKCYANDEYEVLHEAHPMGGRDVYSVSKGMAELLVAAWRDSYADRCGLRIATARGGNVIGGGDRSEDRLVPDCVRALARGEPIEVRSPHAQRPWQHVLDALSGYLHLAVALLDANASATFETGFNFGPRATDTRRVSELCDALVAAWGEGSWHAVADDHPAKEAEAIHLSIDKAARLLAWCPTWSFDAALEHTAAWYRCAEEHGGDRDALRAMTHAQIESFRSPVVAP